MELIAASRKLSILCLCEIAVLCVTFVSPAAISDANRQGYLASSANEIFNLSEELKSSPILGLNTLRDNEINFVVPLFSSGCVQFPLADNKSNFINTTLNCLGEACTTKKNLEVDDGSFSMLPFMAPMIACLALIISVFNFLFSRQTFKVNSRKSVYDDFWFREVFFKKLMSELIEFRKKWSRKKCCDMLAGEDNSVLEEYFSDLATLRDMSALIEVINPDGKSIFNLILDKLDEVPTAVDPEILYSETVAAITSEAFKIHEDMVRCKYKFKSKK